MRRSRISNADIWALGLPSRASRGSTYKSAALPPPRRPRRRWARYLPAASSPTRRRTWRTVQPHEAARPSWVTDRQAPVSSTARAMARRSCILRPVSRCRSAHAVAVKLITLALSNRVALAALLRTSSVTGWKRCRVKAQTLRQPRENFKSRCRWFDPIRAHQLSQPAFRNASRRRISRAEAGVARSRRSADTTRLIQHGKRLRLCVST